MAEIVTAIGGILGGIGTFLFFCWIFFGVVPVLSRYLKRRHDLQVREVEVRRLEAEARLAEAQSGRSYVERR